MGDSLDQAHNDSNACGFCHSRKADEVDADKCQAKCRIEDHSTHCGEMEARLKNIEAKYEAKMRELDAKMRASDAKIQRMEAELAQLRSGRERPDLPPTDPKEVERTWENKYASSSGLAMLREFAVTELGMPQDSVPMLRDFAAEIHRPQDGASMLREFAVNELGMTQDSVAMSRHSESHRPQDGASMLRDFMAELQREPKPEPKSDSEEE